MKYQVAYIPVSYTHLDVYKRQGFKDIVILPRGTNTPLENRRQPVEEEGKLLLQRNKWVIAHPGREPLIRQGAFPGLLGENRELKY